MNKGGMWIESIRTKDDVVILFNDYVTLFSKLIKREDGFRKKKASVQC